LVVSIFAASIVFTLLHIFAHQAELYVLVFIPSLIFGHLYSRYNSLIAPVLMHVWYNFLFLIFVSA